MRSVSTTIVVFIFIFFSFTLPSQEIKIMGYRSDFDPANKYFIDLSTLVLSKTQHLYPNYSINTINLKRITQGRLFRFIDDGSIDVVWSGTSNMREESYIPIRIPLTKGLLGYRVLLINKDNRETFNQINSEKELKKLVACQGAHWPDSGILEDNGYMVSRIVHYDAMFKMIEKKRCDYFPRALFEGRSELSKLKDKYPNIELVENVLLQYHLPVYFFVNKNKSSLAKRLSEGLHIAINDGSFDEFIKNHELTSFVFPSSKWKNNKFFKLKNYNLPFKTPIENKALWLVLDK